MPPTTEPRRRWKWARRIGGLLLLLLIALTALDAWLKSWPIKVMAPCNAEVTVVYAPGIWGQWRRWNSLEPYGGAGGFLVSRDPKCDVPLAKFLFSKDVSSARSLFVLPGAIGRRYVVARQSDESAVFFSPGLLAWALHWETFWTAYRNGHSEGHGDDIFYDQGFAIRPLFDWVEIGLVPWNLDRAFQMSKPGRTSYTTDQSGQLIMINERHFPPNGKDRLWMRVPEGMQIDESHSFEVGTFNEDASLRLDCADPAVMDLVLDRLGKAQRFGIALEPSVSMQRRFRLAQGTLEYPWISSVAHDANSLGFTLFQSTHATAFENMAMEIRGHTTIELLDTLESAGLLGDAIPIEVSGKSAYALPPSIYISSPTVLAEGGKVYLVSDARCIDDLLDSGPVEPEAVAELQVRWGSVDIPSLPPSITTHSDDWEFGEFLKSTTSYSASLQNIPDADMNGTWIAFEEAENASNEPPLSAFPGHAASKIPNTETSISTPIPVDEVMDRVSKLFTPYDYWSSVFQRKLGGGVLMNGIWPHEVWQVAKQLDASNEVYQLSIAWQGLNGKGERMPGRRYSTPGKHFEVGGVMRPHTLESFEHFFRSASPLVTQSAWSILTMAELYGALDAVDAGPFREGQRQAMQDWSDFLVRWKRGPDAAPLSCIEESAGPDDVYPLLVVYLGLKAGADWFHTDGDNVPEAWSHRLDDLRTELLAQLLQPGQCLTCPDLLMPLAEAIGQLSPAALDALHRLPPCPPPDREDYGVLPRCPPSP